MGQHVPPAVHRHVGEQSRDLAGNAEEALAMTRATAFVDHGFEPVALFDQQRRQYHRPVALVPIHEVGDAQLKAVQFVAADTGECPHAGQHIGNVLRGRRRAGARRRPEFAARIPFSDDRGRRGCASVLTGKVEPQHVLRQAQNLGVVPERLQVVLGFAVLKFTHLSLRQTEPTPEDFLVERLSEKLQVPGMVAVGLEDPPDVLTLESSDEFFGLEELASQSGRRGTELIPQVSVTPTAQAGGVVRGKRRLAGVTATTDSHPRSGRRTGTGRTGRAHLTTPPRPALLRRAMLPSSSTPRS